MRHVLAASTLALSLGTAAGADPWSVLVIGGDSDAIALSSRLAATGVADVRLLTEGDGRDIAEAVRISRGNKGTTFVLLKESDE